MQYVHQLVIRSRRWTWFSRPWRDILQCCKAVGGVCWHNSYWKSDDRIGYYFTYNIVLVHCRTKDNQPWDELCSEVFLRLPELYRMADWNNSPTIHEIRIHSFKFHRRELLRVSLDLNVCQSVQRWNLHYRPNNWNVDLNRRQSLHLRIEHILSLIGVLRIRPGQFPLHKSSIRNTYLAVCDALLCECCHHGHLGFGCRLCDVMLLLWLRQEGHASNELSSAT